MSALSHLSQATKFAVVRDLRSKLWLDTSPHRDLFLAILEQVHQRYRFAVPGYVVILSELQEGDPLKVKQVLTTRKGDSAQATETK